MLWFDKVGSQNSRIDTRIPCNIVFPILIRQIELFDAKVTEFRKKFHQRAFVFRIASLKIVRFLVNGQIIKWGESSRWPFCIFCPKRNSGKMTVCKTHPTLLDSPLKYRSAVTGIITKPTAKSAAANERRNLKLLFLTRLSLSRLIHRITFVQIVEIVKIIIKLNDRVKVG